MDDDGAWKLTEPSAEQPRTPDGDGTALPAHVTNIPRGIPHHPKASTSPSTLGPPNNLQRHRPRPRERHHHLTTRPPLPHSQQNAALPRPPGERQQCAPLLPPAPPSPLTRPPGLHMDPALVRYASNVRPFAAPPHPALTPRRPLCEAPRVLPLDAAHGVADGDVCACGAGGDSGAGVRVRCERFPGFPTGAGCAGRGRGADGILRGSMSLGGRGGETRFGSFEAGRTFGWVRVACCWCGC